MDRLRSTLPPQSREAFVGAAILSAGRVIGTIGVLLLLAVIVLGVVALARIVGGWV